MSYAPHGQGVPYGIPAAKGPGNPVWNKGSAKAARELGGALPEQTYRRQQPYRPPQSESERRYVDRVAQELPDNLKTAPNSSARRQGEYQYPDYPDSPDQAARASPSQNSPSSRGPPRRQGDPYLVPISRLPRPSPDGSPEDIPKPRQNSPTPAWPLRGDSSRSEESANKGAIRAARENTQGSSDRPQKRPDILVPRLEQLAQSGSADAPAGMNYGWPAQPPLQSPPGRPVRVQPKSPHAQEPYRGEEFLSPTSPNMSRPVTDSSYASDSSIGSIPDFPVPQSEPPPMPPPPQPSQMPRRIPLGPPPSARRGPSSYYSQQSFGVSPIVEEAERVSHGSYASSNVIPSGVPDYYMDDTPSDDESPRREQASMRLEDHDDDRGLVRQASLGKRAKPSLIPVRDNSQRADVSKGGIVAQAAMAAGAAGGAFAAGLGNSRDATRETTPQPSMNTPTALADPSSSETSLSSIEKRIMDDDASSKRPETVASMDIFGDMKPVVRSQSPVPRTGSPYKPNVSSPLSPNAPMSRGKLPMSPQDAQREAILAGLERGGALDKDSVEALRSPKGGLAERAGLRRPPRLNVDAVREAEARGSLTSLPDLIRRATRLAANLDRGKTASRLGMEWFISEARKEGYEVDRKSASGSLSDILASFPPPGLATPTGNRSPGTRGTGWPEMDPRSRDMGRDEMDPRFVFEKPSERKQPRRCCGMPRWAFILLMIVLILLIAAAVVIPIGLVVIPRQKSTNQGANTALSVCQKQFACQNGGSSILTRNGQCGCLCVNGFSGAQCTAASDSSCTTMSLSGAPNATVGSAIPRLVDVAQSNFSIPLDSQRVLAQFSSSDLSCTTQDALVTLNGATTKRSVVNLYIPLAVDRNPFTPDTTSATATPSPDSENIIHDQAIYAIPTADAGWDGGDIVPTATRTEPALFRRATETANGVVFASGNPSDHPSSTKVNAAATSTRGASSATSTASTPAELSGTNTDTDMDFARIAILFILQETASVNDASDAQGRLSDWFGDSNSKQGGDNATAAAKNLTLGASGWFMDFVDLRVTVKNGTVFGKTS
ncbi:hypothetical protein NA57DRAFT_71015 [Rhizodiscina lignyota]|uniref:EGF-like domain-containing protein n=1 Tax=Rhizodiscina lignyota TaxID=1504668 RepID=A0A9P4INL5_9PEZI|nr:hypothetical protein NA57DRAFT_71015 [Rhizodiscina lignyota]